MISLILCQLCPVKDREEKGSHSFEVQELKGRMKNTSILYSSPTSSRAAFCHLNKIKCFSKILRKSTSTCNIEENSKSLFLCYHSIVF